MTNIVPINIGYEDILSRALMVKAMAEFGEKYYVGSEFHKGGYGELKKVAPIYNRASKNTPGLAYFILTDLDKAVRVVDFIREWIPEEISDKLVFRVAVTEAEAWLMADRESIARLFGISIANIPINPDSLADPKATLVALARTSRH